MNILIVVLATIPVAIIYTSFFEWFLHKNVMHKPVGGFKYAFRAHALTHHSIFKADGTYFVSHNKNHEKITMAWWNPLVLIPIATSPSIFIGWWFNIWAIPWTTFIIVSVYYGAYEYLHLAMHAPKCRWFEETKIFKKLNRHHLLHHLIPKKNLNVVLPIADLIFGTLITKSPFRFPHQATGPSMLDIQPLE